jgi:hypothetical protein
MIAASPPPQRRPDAPVSDDNLPEPHAAVTEAADETEMPLPSDPRTFFLGGLFALGVFAVLYVASAIILPVVLAFVLNLLLQTRCPSFRACASAPRCRSALDRPPGYWSTGRSCGGLISTGRDLG